jgi:hypothetical protein
MAQTGFTPIQLYFSSTTTNVPLAANLANGELAINITDGKLFYKDNANAVQVIGWKVVPATAGGTGQTSYAVGDLLYANTTTTLAKLPDVATGNALISGGVNTAPSWGKIGLTTHISGVLPVANGGTNASAASITAFNNITGYTASGATGTTSTNLVFSTSPSITTPTLVGDATLSTGNLIQGTAAKGVNFTANTPATGMTSQLLNWYEEGTYTATVTCGTSGTVSLYSTYNSLSYTRVGRLVVVRGQLKVQSVSSPVGYFTIPLPFAIGNFGNEAGSGSGSITMQNVNAANISDFVMQTLETETSARVYLGNASNLSATAANELKAFTDIFVTITYFA